jgi:hypothetical protein
MDINQLKTGLETIGIATTILEKAALEKTSLSAQDIELLSNCGLPKQSAPDLIHFVQSANPKDGNGLKSLAQTIEKYSNNVTAQACYIIAKDSMGNLFWINTSANHQLTFDDHDYGMKRFVNESLSQFLSCIYLYNKFLKTFGNVSDRFLFQTKEKAKQKDFDQLKNEIISIDPKAITSPDNYWMQIGFDGI